MGAYSLSLALHRSGRPKTQIAPACQGRRRGWAAVALLALLPSCSSVDAAAVEVGLVVDAYATAAPSVVRVETEGVAVDPEQQKLTEVRRLGSGVAIEPGLVVTNYHVIEDARRVDVTVGNGRSRAAVLLGTAPDYDLALLRVPYDRDELPPARLGSSRELRIGQRVLTISNPLGLDRSLSTGVISGLGRRFPWMGTGHGFIQFDAPINPGHSGGPLVDTSGRVIGIITGKVMQAEGVGFAIPIDAVTSTISDLQTMGHPFRPSIGFTGTGVDPDMANLFDLPAPWGVLVEEVEPDSLAAEIGLRAGHRRVALRGREFVLGGDIIVAVEGIPIRGPYDLDAGLSNAHPGQKLRVSLVSPEGERTLELTVPEMQH